MHKKYGVRVLSRNVITDGLADISERLDVVTSFDSMEHGISLRKGCFGRWATSSLSLADALRWADPTASTYVSGSACLSGIGKWSTIEDWYEEPEFRGHVREPDVADLRYIARDMGLKDVQIFGGNWQGYGSRSVFVRLSYLDC